ncbi:MAG: tRNA modification GTPase, partial [Bacteroidia bacterium]
ELELDFGEEDVEFASRDELRQLVSDLRSRLLDLEESFALGNALKKGFALVLAGRPNAGKSTLFNALLREEKAIVSDIAGTTRDALEDQLFLDGFRVRLIDTAGIREASDAIERLGIERTWSHVSSSGATLFLVDASTWNPADLDKDWAALAERSQTTWVLATKLDLQPELGELEQWVSEKGLEPLLSVNLKDAESLSRLRLELTRRFSAQIQPYSDQTIVTNARHADALERCRKELDDLLAGMDAGLSGDLLAFHLRQGIAQLGRITGEIDADEVLGSIFSSFCIGK